MMYIHSNNETVKSINVSNMANTSTLSDNSTAAGCNTHTHPFNGPFSGTTGEPVPKGKTNLDFTEARDSEWQWNQLDHMQVCTLLQTDNHTSTPPLCFLTGRMPFLPPNQQCQSTEGTAAGCNSRLITVTIRYEMLF